MPISTTQIFRMQISLAQNLSGSNLMGADVRGAHLGAVTDYSYGCTRLSWGGCLNYGFKPNGVSGGIDLAQLQTTASYQIHDLSGIDLTSVILVGATFAGYNLTNANLTNANLTNASLRNANLSGAALDAADLSGADTRGATGLNSAGAIVANLIRPDGHVDGLDLAPGEMLVVRDFYGDPSHGVMPLPITVDQHFAMGTGGTLQVVFESYAWDSTISFAAGIPVSLDGTLELMFADGKDLASQNGLTFQVFNWTGVSPTGAFAVVSPYTWNLSNLYTTGEVTLTAVPEPNTFFLFSFGLAAIFAARSRRMALKELKMLFAPVFTLLTIVTSLTALSDRALADAPVVELTKIGAPTWKPADFQLFSAPAAPFPTEFNHVYDTLAPLDGPSVVVYTPHAPPYDTELSTGAAAGGYVNQSVFDRNAILLQPNAVYFAFMLLPDPGITGSSRDFASGPVISNSVFPLSSNVDVWLDGLLVDRLLGSDVDKVSVGLEDEPFQGTSHLPGIEAVWYPWDDDYSAGPLGSYELRWSLRDVGGSGWNMVAPFQVVSLPGDFNHDGAVDSADYAVWRKNPGGTYTQNDYNLWRTNFGRTFFIGSGAGVSANAAVPEPATLVLLIFAAAGWCLRRRRAA